MANDEPAVIPMKSKVIHKFYEPLVLYKALSIATRSASVSPVVDASIDTTSEKEVFETFVYKVAHVCDKFKGSGGSTISSLAVLNHENKRGKAHYWFASNQRTHEELEETRTYLRDLLRTIDDSPTAFFQRSNVVRSVLTQVLGFNRPKVTHYLQKVHQEAKKCLSTCSEILGKLFCSSEQLSTQSIVKLISRSDSTMTRHLNMIRDTVAFVLQENLEAETFSRCTKSAIRTFEQQQSNLASEEIAARAVDGRKTPDIPSKVCWSELQHAISRLLSYPQSVRFMLLAKEKWPQLFQDFEISFLESSEPAKKPFRNSSQNAFNIVGRLTRKPKEIEIFRRFAEELQSFNLDTLIQNQYRSDNFHPIVHSEVLLLDFLSRTGRLNREAFFNRWMYIGSSKPTCKLCHYYFKSFFEVSKIQVEHRPSHGNLYTSWRVPDVLASQGPEGENAREKMVAKILEKVRKDAFDIVRKRSPSSYKPNDSNTFSARLSLGGWVTTVADVDDVTSMLGQVDLNH